MNAPRVTNLPTWAIVAILTAGSGGVGVVGGAIGSSGSRPDPYTGTEAERDFAAAEKARIKLEDRINGLEQTVRKHNAESWRYIAMIDQCVRVQREAEK